jgi:hypothetical protein
VDVDAYRAAYFVDPPPTEAVPWTDLTIAWNPAPSHVIVW